jgi:hypothetical protein
MSTYMVWMTESECADGARAYSGHCPEVAIIAFCEDKQVGRMELVTAAESLLATDGDTVTHVRKPGGKSWTTQVDYEERRDYSVCGLSED